MSLRVLDRSGGAEELSRLENSDSSTGIAIAARVGSDTRLSMPQHNWDGQNPAKGQHDFQPEPYQYHPWEAHAEMDEQASACQDCFRPSFLALGLLLFPLHTTQRLDLSTPTLFHHEGDVAFVPALPADMDEAPQPQHLPARGHRHLPGSPFTGAAHQGPVPCKQRP